MDDEISWQVELSIKPGELDNFRALTREMVESTRFEQGVLIYERFLSDGGDTVLVYERYVNSAAALAHLRAFDEKFGARFTTMVERKLFRVLGTPDHELRGMLSRLNATYMRRLDGFSLAQSR